MIMYFKCFLVLTFIKKGTINTEGATIADINVNTVFKLYASHNFIIGTPASNNLLKGNKKAPVSSIHNMHPKIRAINLFLSALITLSGHVITAVKIIHPISK